MNPVRFTGTIYIFSLIPDKIYYMVGFVLDCHVDILGRRNKPELDITILKTQFLPDYIVMEGFILWFNK
jgi:hypothetical protein